LARPDRAAQSGLVPGGPAAAVADEFAGRRIRNVLLGPIRAEDVIRACMGMEEQAAAGHLRPAYDPLLDAHIGLLVYWGARCRTLEDPSHGRWDYWIKVTDASGLR
jgi:hypothetical protein